MRRPAVVRLSLLAGLAGALAILGCGGDGPQDPGGDGTTTVRIVEGGFSPNAAVVRLADGGRVLWRNADAGSGGGPYDGGSGGASHTVTADVGGFGSGSLGPGLSFGHTFTTAGTYAYHCSIHPEMTGTIRVEP
jgi:hypothetical protein